MTETISLILGAILPPFIDFLTKKVTNSNVRYGISLLACILVGMAINYQKLNTGEILESIGLVFVSAQTIYKTYWSTSELRSEENK